LKMSKLNLELMQDCVIDSFLLVKESRQIEAYVKELLALSKNVPKVELIKQEKKVKSNAQQTTKAL